MPKPKKIKKIPSKIKSVKVISKDAPQSDLEKEVAKKEVEDFVEFLDNTNIDIDPSLHESPSRQQEAQRAVRVSATEQTARPVAQESPRSYEGASAAYTPRQRSTNDRAYDPSIRVTNPVNTDANAQRSLGSQQIGGQRSLNQNQLFNQGLDNQPERNYSEKSKERRVHEGG